MLFTWLRTRFWHTIATSHSPEAMTELVNAYKPEILLLGATTLGRDLAGSVATTLLTGLTADTTALAIDDERSLAATRPTFGGSLLCTIHTLNYRPQMATVRPRVMPMPDAAAGPPGAHRGTSAATDRGRLRHQGAAVHPRPRLSQGAACVCRHCSRWRVGAEIDRKFPACQKAGRGLWAASMAGRDRWRRKAGLPPIGRLARPARPSARSSTSPPGISGAIQHRVGVEDADLIVAINSDPNAPIFDFAHIGIVADAVELLPVLTETFRRRLALNCVTS